MNKTFKIGLGMLTLEFGGATLIGLIIALSSITWTAKLLLIISAVVYNLLALALLLAGLFKEDKKPISESERRAKYL